jgi:hypothetical protein
MYIYFELQKTYHHFIILNFIIQSRSTAWGYQLVIIIIIIMGKSILYFLV